MRRNGHDEHGPSGLLKVVHEHRPKVIGLSYMITSIVVFYLAGLMALGQCGCSGTPSSSFITLAQFNELFTMHGSLMAVPVRRALRLRWPGNYIVPLQVGAPDMAFPRLNALSYWLYAGGTITMLMGFLRVRSAANFGWWLSPALQRTTAGGRGRRLADGRWPHGLLGHLHRREPGGHLF